MYMVYSTNLESQSNNPRLLHFDLGDIADGGWHTVQRDLEADLKGELPKLELLKVNNMYIFGSLKIDNLMLYKLN